MTFSPITLGVTLRTFQTATASITDTVHEPNQRLGLHVHERANLAFVTHGRFEERCGKMRWDCRPGDLILKPAATAHGNQYGPQQSRCLLVEFHIQHPIAEPALERAMSAPARFRDPVLAALGRGIHSELAAGDDFSDIAIEGALLQMLARAARISDVQESSPPRHVRIARDLMHAQIGRRTSLRQLAETTGVGAGLLVRHFRHAFGLSPAEYQRRLRIEKACVLITSSRRSLAEIAYGCGFANQSHLTHSIRRTTGLTPGQLRNRSRSPSPSADFLQE